MKTGALRVSMSRIVPNTWNPNKMVPELYKKLKRGIKQTLKETGDIPPIVVRPNEERGAYEIIDGYHRWKVLQELGEKKIRVHSIDVDDKTARILTTNLNYLRGSPDRSKYAENIVELIGMGMSTEDLASILPDNAEMISMYIDEASLSFEAYKALQDDDADDLAKMGEDYESSDDDIWVKLRFRVSVTQAKVIEQEIARIGGHLKGRNVRGRALEYMAAQSSQCLLED